MRMMLIATRKTPMLKSDMTRRRLQDDKSLDLALRGTDTYCAMGIVIEQIKVKDRAISIRSVMMLLAS